MNDLLNRVIDQFDTLIPFLALSYEDVFELLQKEKSIWFLEDQRAALPDSYTIYRTHITHSAFLLGYSYFEAFLADLTRKIYLSNPKMLPKEKKLSFTEILEATDYESVLQMMIEKEIIAIFYKSMDDIIRYFEEKLNLTWPDEYNDTVIVASYLRNCIIHNLSRADDRLSKVSEYEIGKIIELDSSDVHSFGIKARDLVRNLHGQAVERYFNS